MENKKVLKLTDFQKNEENPFMKQAIKITLLRNTKVVREVIKKL
ncbi:hypothetical protein NXV23_23175 (plasmid) [Bacteroides fragilis]|nr:hypothetical protein [Bacteroides fragilis]